MRPENPRFVLEAIEALRDERMEVRNSNFAAIKAALPNFVAVFGLVGCRDQSLGTMARQRRTMFALAHSLFIGRSEFRSDTEELRIRFPGVCAFFFVSSVVCP
jgi:hypothetical protein